MKRRKPEPGSPFPQEPPRALFVDGRGRTERRFVGRRVGALHVPRSRGAAGSQATTGARTRVACAALLAVACVACAGRGEPPRATVVHGRGEGSDRIFLRLNEAEYLRMPAPDPGLRDPHGRDLDSARRYAERYLARTGECPAGFDVVRIDRATGPLEFVITVQCR